MKIFEGFVLSCAGELEANIHALQSLCAYSKGLGRNSLLPAGSEKQMSLFVIVVCLILLKEAFRRFLQACCLFVCLFLLMVVCLCLCSLCRCVHLGFDAGLLCLSGCKGDLHCWRPPNKNKIQPKWPPHGDQFCIHIYIYNI